MTETLLVQRYVSALRAEADAVRDLTKIMKKDPIPEDQFRELEERYKTTVEERKAALKALWG